MELTNKQLQLFESLTEKYPDFPIKGITFKDLSLLYTSNEALTELESLIISHIKPRNPESVIGCDARGFILGTLVSRCLKIPLVLARKAGKLPGVLLSKKYGLEYGSAELQMHKHIITKYKSPVITDDILATGGTVLAITDMLKEVDIIPNSYFFLSEIVDLEARKKLQEIAPVLSILK
jgi:adenine phosphoribosyltransferase